MNILVKMSLFALHQFMPINSLFSKIYSHNLAAIIISKKHKCSGVNKVHDCYQFNATSLAKKRQINGLFLLEIGRNQYDTYKNMNDDISASIYYVGSKRPVLVDSLVIQNNIKKGAYQELITPWQVMGDKRYDGEIDNIIKQVLKNHVHSTREGLLNPYNYPLNKCGGEYRKYVSMKRHLFLLVKGTLNVYDLGKFDYMDNHTIKQKKLMIYFSEDSNYFNCETMNII
jgi:hypothetical protein